MRIFVNQLITIRVHDFLGLSVEKSLVSLKSFINYSYQEPSPLSFLSE